MAHPKFLTLNANKLKKNYITKFNRVFLLDIDGTLAPEDDTVIKSFNHLMAKPSEKLIKVLKNLSTDPKNSIYLITGQGKDFIGPWFSEIKSIGIGAEYGYNYKEINSTVWSDLFNLSSYWKTIAIDKCQMFVEKTDGSEIEVKKSSVVWKFNKVFLLKTFIFYFFSLMIFEYFLKD